MSADGVVANRVRRLGARDLELHAMLEARTQGGTVGSGEVARPDCCSEPLFWASPALETPF